MDSNKVTNNKSKDKKTKETNVSLDNLKSNYDLDTIVEYIQQKKLLEIVKYNKKIQNRLDLDIEDYKKYYENFTPVEIEVIPCKNKFGKFIIVGYDDVKKYYHIFFSKNNHFLNFLNLFWIC